MNIDCTQANTEKLHPAQYLFSESHGRMVFAIPSNSQTKFEKLCQDMTVPAFKIGKSIADSLFKINIGTENISLNLNDLKQTYSDGISKIMEAHPENE